MLLYEEEALLEKLDITQILILSEHPDTSNNPCKRID